MRRWPEWSWRLPYRPRATAPEQPSLLEQLEESLHPWVAFAVLPLFAFANAGVSLQGVSLAKLLAPVPLGIALGLLVGKPLGIFGAAWLAVKGGLASRPEGASWGQVLGIGMLGGIGFTMSLFIGTLAFPDPAHAAQLRLGVLAGSLLSAAVGYLVLRMSTGGRRPSADSGQSASSSAMAALTLGLPAMRERCSMTRGMRARSTPSASSHCARVNRYGSAIGVAARPSPRGLAACGPRSARSRLRPTAAPSASCRQTTSPRRPSGCRACGGRGRREPSSTGSC